MHTKTVKGILSAKNGMNLYRGCTHGCIYCDSRSSCYQMDHAFEDIEVKENAIELLEASLKKKRNKAMIGTGSMTDPYMPLEKQIQLTHKSLEVIDKYGFGVTVITKSQSVLDDLDLYKKINQKSKAIIQMTLTTFDEDLCKIIEPNVSSTYKRFEALKVFRDNDIPTVVWLTPILPFINDTQDNLKGILDYCVEAKVKGIICFEMGVTLREGDREYFYQKLDEHFPHLKEKYIQTYGNTYSCLSLNHKELMKTFIETCQKHQIMYNTDEIFKYLSTFEDKQQISLF